ncbi:transglutaminase-like domain-containing protein [Arcobacter sp.]|uniref:transglutaminase-like domain-containing protein n=1 Tax=unclassified Arcobacter TaxID=2593671 RepID=UPI003B0086B7|eukprot:TRINITY_DN10099_c0_g1_i2.p1 TRINITY_DN10099_c0_g1~~TRINITY_DN10099_c0_g1_i2.p1  ORF type:complete len:364 (-),score=-14.42 TRINITY_DN10099_c0_g1_i2:321-1412(-)
MERRTFLKGSALLTTTMLVSPSFLSAKETNAFGIKEGTRKFTITNKFEIKPSDEETQLWVPLPLDSTYQKVANLKYEGNYAEAYIAKNDYDTKVLYVKWNKGTETRVLTVKIDMVTMQKEHNLKLAKNNMNYPKDVQKFLEGTKHIPVSDKMKAFTDNIIKDAKTPLEKAKAIYDWTVTTMYRDNSVIGCGVGDAKKAIEEKIYGGKCTDISSVFVTLLRNANIPAREVFGIRVGKSKIAKACGKADENGLAKITGGQHCRAEFYISGLGWVPADPADVTKVRLAEKLTNEDQKVKDAKKFMFGNWEMNWVAFNYARDFVLNPKPAQYPLNMLGYPYAENGEDPLDYYDAKNFSYSYISQEHK